MSGEGAPAVSEAGTCNTMEQPAPPSLLDLPAPWLVQLLAAEPNMREVLPLFSCCRFLRDLVLSQRSVLLFFNLPLWQDQQADAQAKLLLACKYQSRVQLFCEAQHEVVDSASVRHLLTSTMATAGQPLTAITNVTLRAMQLDALVPSWLTTTCPNMACLKLRGCQISWPVLPGPTSSGPQCPQLPAPTTSIPQCPQLRQLELSFSSSQLPSDQPTLLRWQHQLRSLTGLNSLCLFGGTSAEPQFLLQCCSVLGTQLTQLSLISMTAAQLDLPHLLTVFPRVRDLRMPHVIVDDEGMEALLSLQTLRTLRCTGFQLQHSYTHRPCPWTHLGFWELDVTSVDRISLEGVQQFIGAVDRVIPSNELDANARVAAAVVRCGIDTGICIGHDVHMDNRSSGAQSACLAALMPMLSACKTWRLTVSHARPVTPELLAAMGQYLGRSAEGIQFQSCTISPEAWALLLPSLPRQVASVRLSGVEGMTEAQVAEMCVHAGHPVKVVISGGVEQQWQAGWEGRVQAAMAAAGHQRVTLHGIE